MTQSNAPPVHAIVPLAVLETVRRLDAPRPDGLSEYHPELASKRLGMSATVAAQIARFADMVDRGQTADAAEVEQLFRLAGRRADAALVFDEAGRRAAWHAAHAVPRVARMVGGGAASGVRHAVGRRLVAGLMRRVFGLAVGCEDDPLALTGTDGIAVRAVPGGAACGFYGAAAAALLRRFVRFEGAVVHVRCRARGDAACVWRAVTLGEE